MTGYAFLPPATVAHLMPRAATVSSRQVSPSTGTPLARRSARVRRSGSLGIGTGFSGCSRGAYSLGKPARRNPTLTVFSRSAHCWGFVIQG